MVASLRARRAVFWYLGADRIVAAVIARAEREPVLEACAASYCAPVAGSCFAPGVIEVAWVLGCEQYAHVAALAAPFCRLDSGEPELAPSRKSRRFAASATALESDEEIDVGMRGGERLGLVSGAGAGMRVWAHEGAVAQASGLFRRARLHLVALDCEPCALASLSDVLGTSDAEDAKRQHLSAVTVMPESETAAEALGEDLAVPVGLAVAWFGSRRAR